MAHIISFAETLSLVKIAKHLVGQQIQAGLILEQDGEDYVQELLSNLIQEQDSIDVPKESSFENYAYLIMKRELIDVWRKFHTSLYAPGVLVSMHTPVKNGEGESIEFGDLLIGDEDFPESDNAKIRRLNLIFDVRVFVENLSPDDRAFCEMLMSDDGQRTIAIMSHRSRGGVRRKIRSLRKRMILAGLDEYLKKN